LENVRVTPAFDLATAAPVWTAVRAVEAELGAHGRVLVRPSGTEPLIRVMAEAPTHAAAQAAVDQVKAAVASVSSEHP
jgi:phosphoglucosamine mutase